MNVFTIAYLLSKIGRSTQQLAAEVEIRVEEHLLEQDLRAAKAENGSFHSSNLWVPWNIPSDSSLIMLPSKESQMRLFMT